MINGHFFRENHIESALECARELNNEVLIVNGLQNNYFYVPTHVDIEKAKKEFSDCLYDETGILIGLSAFEKLTVSS